MAITELSPTLTFYRATACSENKMQQARAGQTRCITGFPEVSVIPELPGRPGITVLPASGDTAAQTAPHHSSQTHLVTVPGNVSRLNETRLN